jgi:hypothetical protein
MQYSYLQDYLFVHFCCLLFYCDTHRPIPIGFHGKLRKTRKATGMEHRSTTTRGVHCHGDFCALAPQLVQATQDRQRQAERAEDERRAVVTRQAESDRQRQAESSQAAKGMGKGYINFSMLAAVAMREKEREKGAAVAAVEDDISVRLRSYILSCPI